MIYPALFLPFMLSMATANPMCTPVTITASKVADLQFGTFTAGPAGGNVIMDPLGTRHCTGDLQPTAAASGPTIFSLTGPPLATFTWDVSPDSVSMGAGNRLNVFSFHGATRGGSLAFDAKGQAQLQIGASLAAAPLCPAGSYRQDQLVLRVSASGSTASCRVTFAVLAGMIAPLSILETASLNFGAITAQAKTFTVKITPAGLRSLSGGGTFSAGAFSIAGQPRAVIALSLPSAGILLKGRGADMVLKDFTADQPGTLALGASGQLALHVGGTLVVNANQAKGAYAGQYPVTVNYLF